LKERSLAAENLEHYFRKQQVSPQWLGVLRAMALEMTAFAGVQGMHGVFFNIGQRFAGDAVAQFANVETIDDLERHLNVFWANANWGWVKLVESEDGIDIAHQAAPLAEAFGDEALEWSAGLLEGFYQTIFTVLGASDKMVARRVGASTDGMDIRLRFGF
jgi:hypothetical protein